MLPDQTPAPAAWIERLRDWKPTLRYLAQTEVHVYAFSIAANMLLSFFPFLIVMVSLCRHWLGWRAAEQAIYLALRDYFPEQLGQFLQRNLESTVSSRGAFQLVSLALLLFTANGIFEPLEVALNRAWGMARNRSYFRNQVVSLGLMFACGSLALFSVLVTALNQQLWSGAGSAVARLGAYFSLTIFRMAAVPTTMLALFLVYWLLPNGRVPWRRVAPAAMVVGVALELLKYVNFLTWPWLRGKLHQEYGPFVYSVSIVLWGFSAAMIMLAGAEWSARVPTLAPAATPPSKE